VPGKTAAKRALDVVDLTDPIQLIARQIQQDDNGGIHRIHHMWHVHLVDLERGHLRAARTRQRGDQPGVHVRALGVGGDRPESAKCGRRHPCRRGLAVRAGHHHRATASTELAKDRLVQRQGHQTTDHRASAATGDPRRPARACTGRQSDPSSSGDHPGHFR
jgi:hypothetical protein